MKKIIVFLSAILAIAIVVILFNSCEDQTSVYNPGKKISKVYEKESGKPEYLTEKWVWSGNKVVSISYYEEGEFDAKDEFIYEGSKVVKIRDSRGYYVDYNYIGKKFESLKFHNAVHDLLIEVTFQYDGEKISLITLKEYGVDKNVISMIERGFLGKLLSKEGMKSVAEKLANPTKATTVIDLSYEGENLSSITEGDVVTTFANYDTHSNVLYNFFPYTAYRGFNHYVFSKNNPGTITVQRALFTSITYNTYTYDGDFPVTIQSSTPYAGVIVMSTIRIVYQ